MVAKLDSTPLRWVFAFGWTAFLLYYLTRQPGTPAVEVIAPVAAPDWQREVAFTIGHILGFGILFMLWWLAWQDMNASRSLIIAIAITLGVGLTAEFLQSLMPDRSASVYDMMMNIIGIGLFYGLFQVRERYRS